MLHEITERETLLLVMLFPQLAGLDLLRAEDLGPDGIRITARTRTRSAACRRCGQVSASGHDRYPRRLRDLPCGGRPAEILVSARRFRCLNPACAAATFAEQVPGLTAWYQRRSQGLRGLLETAALALAGRAGARLAAALGAPVSRHTLIRLVRAQQDPEPGQVRILGVDDVATRRGRVYATVLVDMETHTVIGMLPDREADTFAARLREHPGIEVICRDRASADARAAREAAPCAIQAADRFHLCRNLAEAVEKTVLACASALEPDGPDPAQPDRNLCTHGGERRLPARQRELYAAVSELRGSGLGVTAISRQLGLTRKTVSKYYHAASPGDLPDVSSRPSILDPYKPYLHQRWNEGVTSAVDLHAEIRDRGWKGSQQVVKRYLRQFRDGDGRDRSTPCKPAPSAVPPPRPRQAARWIMTSPGGLSPGDAETLRRILAASPELTAARGLVRAFADMVTGLQGQHLDAWIAAARSTPLPAFHSFANGLERDYDAVRNGLTLHWSSGAVEGTNCKIKHLKRLMYGRANFDLLRKMALAELAAVTDRNHSP